MWNALIAPVAGLFTKALDIVDDLVPDKDLANKIKAQLQQRIMDISNGEFLALLKAQTSIIVAEVQGAWLQRNWRPMLMCLFGIIIANNYLLYPYMSLFWTEAPMLDIPPDMWSLLKLGVSGYVVGRTAEKVVTEWKSK